MNILAIDVGSYSIKFFEVRSERRNFLLVEKGEIILDQAKENYPHIKDINELQKEVVTHLIQNKHSDLKIIFQIPNEMITTRYLEIPGTSKRKTEQIIPFQLDDNLPYPLNQTHFSSRFYKRSGSFSILSNILKLDFFKEFLSFFENKEAGPSVLTSEVSTVWAYIEHIRLNDNCCILDLGHQTTKAYFVIDRQIISNHTSHIAGAAINEVISKTYQITPEEAIIYKHENGFLLSDDQLTDVTPSQKEFALLMKQVFSSLINDIRRFEIGHRVKLGKRIDKIYLFGGSSNINGIQNFLQYHTGLEVEFLPPIIDIKNDFSIHDKNFYLAKMMAISQKTPGHIINFLNGKFQTSSHLFISLHSAIFIWVRSTFIALLLILGLVGERYLFLNKEDKRLDLKISNLLKTPALGINRKDQKLFQSQPETILAILKKKIKTDQNEVNLILTTIDKNAFRPLAILSKVVSNNPNISLEKFSNKNFLVSATFSSADPLQIENLSKHLFHAGLSSFKINKSSDKNILNIEFADKE